jgi:hypothetical protein
VNSNKEYNLVFKGEIANQYEAKDVRKKLSIIFKIPDEKVDRLFSGGSFVIKKNISKVDALVLQQKLSAVGAITYLEPVQLEGLSASVHAHKAAAVPASIVKPAVNNNVASTPVPSVSLSLPPESPHVFSRSAPVSEPELDNTEDSLNGIRGYGITAAQVVPFCMVILAAVLLIAYFPLPDMSLKKGFAIGGLLMFFGIRKLKH